MVRQRNEKIGSGPRLYRCFLWPSPENRPGQSLHRPVAGKTQRGLRNSQPKSTGGGVITVTNFLFLLSSKQDRFKGGVRVVKT